MTRPDISFPVSIVSQFMTSPCDSHWEAVVRILRYIKSDPDKGLLFEDQGHEHIIGYTDVDWAGSASDRRSTFGYCVLVGGNLVSWKIKKQNVVVRSSAQEEYELWQWSHVKSYGSSNFRRVKFEEIKEMKLVCNEIALHIASNQCFMKELSTLRLTVTLSEKRYSREILLQNL